MRFVSQEEQPLPRFQVMGLTTGSKSDLSVQAENRDWPLNSVIGDLVPLAEHHRMASNVSSFTSGKVAAVASDSPSGRRSMGLPGYACCGGWVCAMMTFLDLFIEGDWRFQLAVRWCAGFYPRIG
jgi:hypothetical protein